ncbi:MAG: DEAD/DEAH box helicase [Candidatus Hydrogenedentales bacterium]
MNFEELNIDPRCLRILKSQHITEPTAVQAQAIPVALEGRDLVGIAQTGTGKTLAFALPSLARLASDPGRARRACSCSPPPASWPSRYTPCWTPWPEPWGCARPASSAASGFDAQTKALRQGCPVIVATPGRLLDHIGRRNTRF